MSEKPYLLCRYHHNEKPHERRILVSNGYYWEEEGQEPVNDKLPWKWFFLRRLTKIQALEIKALTTSFTPSTDSDKTGKCYFSKLANCWICPELFKKVWNDFDKNS